MAENNRLKIIKKLDAGGMAEVFIGELIGARGISKRVAVKRILPNLNKHQKFIDMFLDEARLAMALSHANVVQTFDVGDMGGAYYIVMEFIDGTSLKALIQDAKDEKKLLPIGVSIYMVMEAAKGLGYAHAAKDSAGQPLHLVHRDVSPPNILVSVEGEIKVVDFGLAKAASQLESTEPGVIKGKFSYLSPEAVMGLEVDSRADIFALGIILFELLTGRRLFYGATDYETVQLVEKAYVPRASALNPEVPPALEQALAKALARDRNKRFQKASQFIDALNSVLFAYGLKVNDRDVAKLVRKVKGGFEEDEDGSSSIGFDLNLETDIGAEFTGELSVPGPRAKVDRDPKDTGMEDTRSWFNDMGLDDMFDEGEFDLSENEKQNEKTPEDETEDFLSDDMLEEVLEAGDDGAFEIEIDMDEDEQEESVVQGEFDVSSRVSRNPALDPPPAVAPPPSSPSPLPPSAPPSTSPIPPPTLSPKEPPKKGWFSKLFGGDS
jgi:serine/threonine protein kinase